MPRPPGIRPENLVRHPRYGAEPRPSGLKVAEAEIRRGHWRLGSDTLFPDTVLVADTAKQNYAIYPRAYYVDVLRHCRNCRRPFIFFAAEQRYWFETLRLFVDADCVHCPDCRRESRSVHRRLRRYSDVMAKGDVATRKELMFLVDDAIYLVERGVLKNLSQVGALKNRARQLIAEYSGVDLLAKAIDAARQAQRQDQEPG